MADFARQFNALAWKNYKLKLKAYSVLLLEILVPTLIIYLLSLLKSVITPQQVDVFIPSVAMYGNESSVVNMYSGLSCTSENLVWFCGTRWRDMDDSCVANTCNPCTASLSLTTAELDALCTRREIAVAPAVGVSGTAAYTAASDFVTWANNKYGYNDGSTTIEPFTFFSSEQAILNALDEKSYSFSGDIYSSAVIFNGGSPSWDYTVRVNKTMIIDGDRILSPTTAKGAVIDSSLRSKDSWPDYDRGGGLPYHAHWTKSGYLALTNAVNSFATTMACRDSGGTCSDSDDYDYETIGTMPFANDAFETLGFWSAIGFIFSLFMIIVLLYPISNCISALVREKESKLREGMMMMALRSDALWFSWWFNFMCLFLPLSIILTLVGQNLFSNSDRGLIFSYFFLFFLSATAYAIFVSTFFTNSRTASIVGSMVFFGGFFIYVGLMSSNPSNSIISLACLHPACAFTYATLAFAEYEDNGIGVTQYTWNASEDNNITFQECLNMMFIDSILLLVLAWYFDKIWPSEIGTQEPFYFFLTPSYWIKCAPTFVLVALGIDTKKRHAGRSNALQDNVEPVDESLLTQLAAGKCIDVQNLYKEFDTPHGGKKVAVDGLNLTMYNGQITTLLGHNGAGKTTAIAMLTGLIPPDSGTAMIEGVDITENMDEIRRHLGVCPQHDVLFPELTVSEHLQMFAAFKGVPKREIKDEVTRMIEAVGLTEKKDVASKLLSGGQKRKLSVSIAFIGGSRVVFLDEPTSGMDPYSRRFTWNIIRQHREGRVVVLTTHFMDEADLLGDRIAIMGDGKLICCGSSLYLKNQYGVGYSLTLEKKDAITFNSEAMIKVITDRVHAVLLTDVGTEMTWQLPFAASEAFPSLFEHLDDNMDSFGLESYGMSVTTLEEVFIKITRSTHTAKAAVAGKSNNDTVSPKNISADVEAGAGSVTKTSDSAVFVAPNSGKDDGDVELDTLDKVSTGVMAAETSAEYTPMTIEHDFEKYPEEDQIMFFLVHMRALLEKRALYFLRDKKSWLFTFIIPFVFLLAGLLIMKYTYPSTFEPLVEIRDSMYNAGISTDPLPMPYTNAQDNYVVFENPADLYYSSVSSYDHYYARTSSDVTAGASILSHVTASPLIDAESATTDNIPQVLGQTAFDDRTNYKAMMIGSFALLGNDASRETTPIIATNFTAIFAVPLIQQMLASATAKNQDSSHSIRTSYYLLPETRRQDEEFSNYNVDLVVTFMMLALPFVPASFITYIVREKEVKAKHQQMVSGVGVVAYWLSNFLFDNLSFTVTIFLFAILVAGPVFGDDTTQLGGGGSDYSEELGCFFGLLFLFGSSMTGFTYLVSYLFKQPSMAQICMIFVVFILGLVLGIVGIVLRILPDTRDEYESYVQYLLCVFPPFALADGLHNMALITVWGNIEKGGGAYKVTDWRITGLHMMMMGWETFVYLTATILIDLIGSLPGVQKMLECRQGPLPEVNEALKDEDVIEQEELVRSGAVNADNSVILVEGLKKMYAGSKFAVKGITLGIPNGECFGLLGINGAGKSSTLGMLSGEFSPSEGQAFLSGLDLYSDIHKCRRKVGYCPQFDALFELLTAREHLELYARIKGIKEKDIKRVVNAKIAEMGLTEYADRYAGTYSGGNKRKLSVAIAMIGEPSIVFLDEPSTGMDPVARRFMWDVISDIVTKREKCSLILTTHSMEECEALCTRIGIMVGGVMRCLGSAQRLRSKYGKGYQIEFGLEIPSITEVTDFASELIEKGQVRASAADATSTATGAATSTSVVAAGGDADVEASESIIKSPRKTETPYAKTVLTSAEVKECFEKYGKYEWIAHLTAEASGSDLVTAYESQGAAGFRHVCSWMILEQRYEAITDFLNETFTSFILHERQPSKIRIEVPSELPDGKGSLKLSTMFKAVEEKKAALHIESYSMAQTSLEQIFNFFAQQQEEETGATGSMGAK